MDMIADNPPAQEVEGGVRVRRLNWLDRQLGETVFIALLLFGCVCGGPALILGIVGIFVCTDREAKKNAWTLIWVALICATLSLGCQLLLVGVRQE